VQALNTVALRFKEEGELIQAEPTLRRAYQASVRTLGPDHRDTVRTLHELARVYTVAIRNAPPAPPSPVADAPGSPRAQPRWSRGARFAPAPPGPGGVRSSSHRPARKDERLRQTAAQLGYRINRQTAAELRNGVVPVLAKALRSAQTPQEREELACALADLGPAAHDAVPVLTWCARQATEVREREALALALRKIGPAARERVLAASLPAADGAAKATECPLHNVVVCFRGRDGRIGVQDAGGCFSVQALRSTGAAIRELARQANVEVLIETVHARKAPCTRRVQERLRELGPRGVYVLIDRDAPAVHVHVTEALRKQGLTAGMLRAVLQPRIRGGEFDLALQEGVATVTRVEQKAKAKR
jgi:hypothetical protein